MNVAQNRLVEFFRWVELSSQSRPDVIGNHTHVFGKFATPVIVDFAEPPPTNFHPEALPIFIDRDFAHGLRLPASDVGDCPSQPEAHARAGTLIWRVQDHTLPPCAIFALTDPAQAISAAIEAAGGVGVDMALFPVITLPVWHMPSGGRRDVLAELPWRPHRDVDPEPFEAPSRVIGHDPHAWARNIKVVWPT